ncbi:MAG TPA: cytochrome c oxidase subunit 3 family protein [Myxococcota bacterium]|nr:cytochrome c oxidase subunit 3 family protein [Myxococcota bacterium]
MANINGSALFPLADHYATPEQQVDSGKLGMWLFLTTEILLFGGLFVSYACFNYLHMDVFKEAHKYLDWRLGAVNTVVLLFSSLTVVLAIHAAQKQKKYLIVINIALTIACGIAFMAVKYVEYSHKFHAGLLPGSYFTNATIANPDQAHIYFGIYFLMTGLHGFHVLIGIGIFVWLLLRTIKNDFSSQYYAPLELGGLYWHLVDVIWIFLFPLLYLIS